MSIRPRAILRRLNAPTVGCLVFWCLAWSSAGCGGGSPEAAGGGSKSSVTKRIIILTNGTSPYWDAAATGARRAAQDLDVEEAGLQVVVDRNDFSVHGQIDKLKQYANSTDVAAVGISVTDSNNRSLAEEMRRLQAAGIQVAALDSDVDRQQARDARFAYLGTDNVIAGRELGKAAGGLLPEGGEYATFVGLKGAANARERIAGFAEGAGDKFVEVESLADGGDPNVARKNVRDALDRRSQLDLLVGIWSYNGPAAADIARQFQVLDAVKIVTFDAEPVTLQHMAQGSVDAIIVQDPYQIGYEGVRLLKALVEEDEETIDRMFPKRGDAEDGDIFVTGLKIVVPDEGSPLRPEMFDSNTEFLTLSEFRDWLREHGLTGS